MTGQNIEELDGLTNRSTGCTEQIDNGIYEFTKADDTKLRNTLKDGMITPDTGTNVAEP